MWRAVKSSGPLLAAGIFIAAMLAISIFASQQRAAVGGYHRPTVSISTADASPEVNSIEPDAPWVWGFISEINIADAIIAGFTIVLAFSTVGLWRETKRLARHAESQAAEFSRSVDAIELQAKALLAAERGIPSARRRGFVLLRRTKKGKLRIIKPGELVSSCVLRARISNSGKSKIEITDSYLQWLVATDATTRPPQPFTSKEAALPMRWTIPGGVARDWTFLELPTALNEGDLLNIKSGASTLWVWVRFNYTDISDEWQVQYLERWEEVAPKRGFVARGFIGAATSFTYRRRIGPAKGDGY